MYKKKYIKPAKNACTEKQPYEIRIPNIHIIYLQYVTKMIIMRTRKENEAAVKA